MAQGVYRDSLGKCDLYSNPYDTRMQAHPAVIKQRQNDYMRAQDTLNSAQSKLEKEIFQRLTEGNFGLPKGKFIVVAKVGKFLFLAIILPPYLFCYGIPKWLIAEGLPKFYNVTVQFVRRISDKVSTVAHKAVSPLIHLGKKITSPILRFVQTSAEKTRELYSQVKSAIQTVLSIPYRFVNQPIQKAVERIRSFIETVKMVSEKVVSFKNEVKRFFVYLPDNILEKAEALFTALRNRFNDLKPFTPFVKMGNAVSQQMQRLAPVFNFIVLAPYNHLKESYIVFKKDVKERFNELSNQITRWFDPKLNAIKKRWDRLNEQINEVKETVKGRLEEGVKRVVETSVSLANYVVQAIPQPAISLFVPLIQFFKNPRKYSLKRNVFAAAFHKVSKLVDNGLRFAAKWMEKGANASKRLAKKVVEKITVYSGRLFKMLKAILQALLMALKASFLILRLMLAWTKALIKYGLTIVANSLAHKSARSFQMTDKASR